MQGEYSADQALRRLLSGSGLEAVSQDGSSYVLRQVAETEALALPTTDIKGFALGNALGSMDDQGSQTVSQAVRYTPGVLTNPYGATHRYDYVTLTSKRPLYEAYHQVQATAGTQGQRGMGFDFSGPADALQQSQRLNQGAGFVVSAGTFHWFGDGVSERLASPERQNPCLR